MSVERAPRIKTLTVHPRSGIESWAGWPDDVRATLRTWNRERRLTFVRIDDVIGQLPRIFECAYCHEWHRPSQNGVVVLDGHGICDDCLIAVARRSHLA